MTTDQPGSKRETVSSSGSNETKIGFITLDWKLNASAILAIILSVTSIIFQLMGYWRGAVVSLYPAEKVLIKSEGNTVRIGARMVYTNDGAERYSALVLKEKVTLRIGPHHFTQWAEDRGSFQARDTIPVLANQVDAAPFIVPPMKLLTHESYFASRERSTQKNPFSDFVARDDLVGIMKQEMKRKTPFIELRFEAHTRQISGFSAGKERWLSTNCQLTLDAGLIRRMEREGWSSRTCRGFG